MANVIDLNVNRAVDGNGNPVAGAKAYFYQSGTTTPVTVYSDAAATTPHATPVVADGSGVFPAIYGASGASLKVNVTTASGAAVSGYPRDPVILFTDTSTGAASISFAPISGNGATNVQTAIANIQAVVNNISAAARGVLDETTLSAMRTALELPSYYYQISVTAHTGTANSLADGRPRGAYLEYVGTGATGFWSGASVGDVAMTIVHDSTNTAVQLGMDQSGQAHYRGKTGGAWGSWNEIITTANITTYVGTTAAIQNSTSGTDIDFTGIPANVSEITIMFDGVSLSGTDGILVQLGDAGGIENTGYVSGSGDSASIASSTSGFAVKATTAADVLTGSMILTSMSTAGTRWVQQHGMYRNGASAVSGGGSKTLSAMIDRVRITRTGTDTFDAGAITIRYR